MATWVFGDNDPETVEAWSELTIRDAEKQMFFAPFMTGIQDKGAIRHPDASKGDGIIQVHTQFAGRDKKGRKLTLYNVGDIAAGEQGVAGDGILRDTGADLDTSTMSLYYDAIAMQARTSGELNEKALLLDFRETAKDKLSRWARRKAEGAVALQLWGLQSWNNTTVLKHWGQGAQTSVYRNTIQTYDSAHIIYAGDATSDATIDSADRLTSQVLSKAETTAFEDLDIPLDPLIIDGEEALILFVNNRGKEQLIFDQDWKDAQNNNVRNPNHPMLKKAIGKIGQTYVIPVNFALNPAANVGRAILCGKGALQMLKVEDFKWWEGFEDNANRRKVISIGGMFGIAPTYVGESATRRNAIAIDYYQRA